MPSEGPVEVPIGGGESITDSVTAVASRLGVAVRVVESDEGPGKGAAFVGDVTIEPDAPQWMIEAALLRAMRPQHVLFLCVANSARSQLAEGLARSLAPDGVRISSAGSEPTSVRPQAVRALAEVGIDISHHVSTGIDEVPRPVSAVITLCAEEVCPVWLEDAVRVHWGLPDPAGADGSDDEKLDAFRSVRIELRRRLGLLFEGRLV